jgi:hypothetical protein
MVLQEFHNSTMIRSFRCLEIGSPGHGSSCCVVKRLNIKVNSTEQPLDTYEYTPDISVTQAQEDVVHKYRFDKLAHPGFETQLRSASSYDDILEFEDEPLVDHKETADADRVDNGKFGRKWLQRYFLCLDLIARKCAEFVARFGTFSDPDDLQDQLQTILRSKDSSMFTDRGSDYSNGNSGNVIGNSGIR